MNVIDQASQLTSGTRQVCVALGMFDGVHLGHQQVLHETVRNVDLRSALSVAITFDRHPSVVLSPERPTPLLYSLHQRLRAIESVGIDSVLLIHFDEAFSQQPAEPFIRTLVRDFGHLNRICIGSNFCFGHRRSGNVALLETVGKELGFEVNAVPPVESGGEVVSSTRIRELVQVGDFPAASALLGRPYAVAGRVVHGDQLGRQLGFPTANVEVDGLVLPPAGVYLGLASTDRLDNRAVANLGYRPTVGEAPSLRLEVHLLDFNGDLYEEDLEFRFGRRLRGEIKFESLSDLKEQIACDIEQARLESD